MKEIEYPKTIQGDPLELKDLVRRFELRKKISPGLKIYLDKKSKRLILSL